MAKQIKTVGDLKEALRGLDDEYDIMLVGADGSEADITGVDFSSDHDGVAITTHVAFADAKGGND